MASDRDEQERYFGDAVYEAYRRGLNTDRVDRDRVSDHFWNGDPPESVADELQQRDRRRQQERDEQEFDEEQGDGIPGRTY